MRFALIDYLVKGRTLLSAGFLLGMTAWGALQAVGAANGPVHEAMVFWKVVWFVLTPVFAYAIFAACQYLIFELCWSIFVPPRRG